MDEEIAKFADLVQRLRYKARWDDSGDLEEAADAIERLRGLESLKPCPFCGGEPRVALRGDMRLMVGCKAGCECFVIVDVPHEGGFLDRINFSDILQAYNTAVEKWNRRMG